MEGLTDYDRLLLTELHRHTVPEDGIVPIGTKKWAAKLHVDDTRLRNAFHHLEELGYLKIEMRGSKIYGARPLPQKTVKRGTEECEVAHQDKPIMSQPNGRGKLYSRKGDGAWEGTYQKPDGKMDRKRFRAETTMQVKELYVDWCHEQDAEFGRAMRERVQPKPKPRIDEDVPATVQKGERKDKDMTNSNAGERANGNIYVITVVGGAGIAWTESFDKAAAVCDALTEAAKASGFAAKYDVVEVKKWIA